MIWSDLQVMGNRWQTTKFESRVCFALLPGTKQLIRIVFALMHTHFQAVTGLVIAISVWVVYRRFDPLGMVHRSMPSQKLHRTNWLQIEAMFHSIDGLFESLIPGP